MLKIGFSHKSGLSTNDTYKPFKKAGDSQKKLTKVTRELERLQSVVSSTGYQIKAKEAIKSKHIEQVMIKKFDLVQFTIQIFSQIKSLELQLKKLKEELE